jgi:Integrase core domain
MENGYVESFNGRFRDQCPNENWFSDLADVRWGVRGAVSSELPHPSSPLRGQLSSCLRFILGIDFIVSPRGK